jgi:hypothetical protein
LSFSGVTDVGLAFLPGLNRLESLALSFTKISGAGLAHLVPLTALRSLRLGGVELTDTDLTALTQLKNLKTLSLAASHMSDAGLKQISSISSLERLDLGSIDDELITDTGFGHLKEMANLQKVYFTIDELIDTSPDGNSHTFTIRSKVLDIPARKVRDANGDEFHDAFNEKLYPEFDE